MGADKYIPGGPRISSKRATVDVFIKLTAAADVAAGGYTIDSGGEYVSSAARSAEGKLLLTLRHQWADLLQWSITTSRTESFPVLEEAATDVDAATPTVGFIFRQSATGGNYAPANLDPDSAVMRITLTFRNTQATS